MSTGLQQLKAFRIKPTIVETFTTEEIYGNISHYLDKMDNATEAYYQTLELTKRVSTESNDYKIILEGFIGSIVDAIKGAINWVIKLIRDFISWVGSLFGGKKKSDKDGGSSPSDEEVKKAIETIQKAKDTAPGSDPVKSHKALFHKYAESKGIYELLDATELKYTLLIPISEFGHSRVDSSVCEGPDNVFFACTKTIINLHNIIKNDSFNIPDIDTEYIISFRKYHKEDKDNAYGSIITNTHTTKVRTDNGALKFDKAIKASDDVSTMVVKETDETVVNLPTIANSVAKLSDIATMDTTNRKTQDNLKIVEKQLKTLSADFETKVASSNSETAEHHTMIMNVKLLTQIIVKAAGYQINDISFKLKNTAALRESIIKISKLPGVIT